MVAVSHLQMSWSLDWEFGIIHGSCSASKLKLQWLQSWKIWEPQLQPILHLMLIGGNIHNHSWLTLRPRFLFKHSSVWTWIMIHSTTNQWEHIYRIIERPDRLYKNALYRPESKALSSPSNNGMEQWLTDCDQDPLPSMEQDLDQNNPFPPFEMVEGDEVCYWQQQQYKNPRYDFFLCEVFVF